MLVLNFIILSLCSLSKCAVALPMEALHDLMTEPELAYYFHTSDRGTVPEYEIVNLPVAFPRREAIGPEGGSSEFDYSFAAFERPIDLKLRENENIISPNLKTYIRDEEETTELLRSPSRCHYLHQDSKYTAAISLCQPKSLLGIIFLENSTLEIHPLTERLQSLYKVEEEALSENGLQDNLETKVPHLVKRAQHLENMFDMDRFPSARNLLEENIYSSAVMDSESEDDENLYREAYTNTGRLTVELAMFFDEPAYKIFAPFFNYDHRKLEDMLLAYLNAVQALYHHPSLGASLELVLVRLDIFKSQPSKMPHHNGERSKLLDSFCAYQSSINPSGDADPRHWDMALYVSGLDFFAYENGRKSSVTMGLATVGGVCLDDYACVIAELGTTNVFGKPYPSAGFTSVYILAHEMGHNLGMHHDGNGNRCPKEGYIMSPSRGTNGETQWSTCSADVMSKLGWAKCLQDSGRQPKHLDHSRFLENPGQIYTAKKQCEVLLRDKDAVMAPNQRLSEICYNLQCKTPHRSGYYLAGPALEGTDCGKGKYCSGGNCVKKVLPKPVKVVPGGWSNWKHGSCSSGCIEKSKGFQMNRRHCNNPKPVNTDKGCEGSSVSFQLCDDKNLCSSNKLTAVEYASQRCKEFSKLLPELDPEGAGLQAPHEEVRVWMGCAIFCRRADTGSYYTPRLELNDLGVSPYFPDGTWCHKENGVDYYCLQHHCLPENFQITKYSGLDEISGDIPFSQNAGPVSDISPHIKNYLSLTPDGKPVQKFLNPEDVLPKEEDWETNDYVEIPNLKKRYHM